MDHPLAPALQLALDQCWAAQPFYRCCVLPHREVIRLEPVGGAVQQQYGWPQLSLGRILSTALVTLPPEERPAAAARVLRRAVGEAAPRSAALH